VNRKKFYGWVKWLCKIAFTASQCPRDERHEDKWNQGQKKKTRARRIRVLGSSVIVGTKKEKGKSEDLYLPGSPGVSGGGAPEPRDVFPGTYQGSALGTEDWK